ncbi:molybdopterin-dependent oxidoreductase [Rhizobium sp. ARZ01]|uniref:molybdopterin cofactor-binding domain-containing protein n=1 Tax=Rhizobium sp. ARZ01 TaxID=2769313 RepID=UPI00177B3628|nr:molybdopterin cofactor-binding domain-containing protein [Rhizobium sp. ARZ01]MBD9375430.1 molybdopterin-dependent oxidoreductase [Rhizobium sp. ARZ01]
MNFPRIRHPEWIERTVGGLKYTRDTMPPGMLVGKLLRCPHPAARLVSLNVDAARATPGVVAVLTGDMLPDRNYKDYGQLDRVAMARDRAVYFGQEIVAVAAETEAAADAAIARILVKWEQLPHVASVDEALVPGAPAVHPDRAPDNVATQAGRRFGDVDAARKRASRQVTGSYGCGPQHHSCMEQLSAVAHWDQDNSVLNLWVPTQSPRNVSGEVAHMLGLDPKQVRLHRVGVGGDFGARVKTSDLEVIVAHLSMMTGRPVSIRLSRDEEFAFAKRQHETRVDITSHYDRSGQVLCQDAKVTVDNGAFIHGGSNQMNYCSILIGSQYKLSGAEVQGRSIYTNKRPGGAFRGAGGPQAVFAIECQMDEIAADLGIDPIDLRLMNLTPPGETTITGWEITSSAASECLQEVRRRLNWDEARLNGGTGRGVGVAFGMHVSGAIVSKPTGMAGIAIEIGQNGGIVLSSGCSDPGTGEYAVIAQLAAAELGVKPEQVELVTMDTLATPFDPGAGSSRATMVTGTAVVAAAQELAGEIRLQAAKMLNCDVGSVELRDGFAWCGGGKQPLGAIAASHPAAQGGTLRIERETSVGLEPVPISHVDAGYGNISPAYAFAAHGVEVEVDLDTGAVRIVRVVAVHDAGTVINPTGAIGQVVGGVAMGLGAALGEQLLWFDGRPHVTSFVDYAMPRADGVPPIDVVFVGKPDPRGPAGAKSISELALMPIAAAVANAIAHATGARVRNLPITPDKICSALDAQPSVTPAPLWRRPRRWRSELVRRSYPLGVFSAMDRFGPSKRKNGPVPAIEAIERPVNAAAAITALAMRAGSRPVAGGTDLLPARAAGLAAPAALVSLAGCSDLKQIAEDDGTLILGAGEKLADVGEVLANANLPGDRAIARTIAAIATPQIRTMATLAGNLCQTNRCWFLRSGFDCYKRGGAGRPCYAVLGDHRYFHAVADAGRCQSVTPSDLASMLCALDAALEVRGPDQTRRVPATSFYTGPGETCLAPNEIVTAIRIPAQARVRGAAFQKLSQTSDGFAIASAAASISLDLDGRVKTARIVLGGVAATPWRAKASETNLVGRQPTPELLNLAAQAWIADTHPLDRNQWKLKAASALVRRALVDAIETVSSPVRNDGVKTPERFRYRG